MVILCVGDLKYCFIINYFFEPMPLQMQGFFKDMNTICKVLNIGQPVLQIMTVLSFEKWHEGSVISANIFVKKCNSDRDIGARIIWFRSVMFILFIFY